MAVVEGLRTPHANHSHYVKVDTTRQHIKKGAHTATTAMSATLQAAKGRFAALITLSPSIIISVMRGKVNAKQRGHSGLLPLCASFILPRNGGKSICKDRHSASSGRGPAAAAPRP